LNLDLIRIRNSDFFLYGFLVKVAVEGSGGSLAQSGDLEFFSKGPQQEEEEDGTAGATTGSSRGGGLGREIHRVITSHAEAAKIGGLCFFL
jgi:hypothetical protein